MKMPLFLLGLVLCFASPAILKASDENYESPVGDSEEAVVNTYQAGYNKGFEDALANRGFAPIAVHHKDFFDGYHVGYFTGMDSQSKYVEGYKKGLEEGTAMKASGKKATLPQIPDEKSPEKKAYRMGYLKGFQDALKNP